MRRVTNNRVRALILILRVNRAVSSWRRKLRLMVWVSVGILVFRRLVRAKIVLTVVLVRSKYLVVSLILRSCVRFSRGCSRVVSLTVGLML